MKRNNYYLFVCSFIPDCHGQARYLKDNAWWTKFKDGSDLYKHRADQSNKWEEDEKKNPEEKLHDNVFMQNCNYFIPGDLSQHVHAHDVVFTANAIYNGNPWFGVQYTSA